MKEIRVDRILEGVVGVQKYKNSVNTGSHIVSEDMYLQIAQGLQNSCTPERAFQNSVNPEHFQRYASKHKM